MTMRRALATTARLLSALGAVACAAKGPPTPAASQAALAPSPPAASPPAASAPTAAASSSPAPLRAGTCRVAADCAHDLICAYEHPGCDAPVGRCMERPLIACAAAFPIATCEGTPAYACLSVPPEVPWFSRDDGKPHFPYARGKSPREIYGAIGEVVVYHVPDELLSDVAMDAQRLEHNALVERRASSAPDDVRAATSLFVTAVGDPSDRTGDERWEIVFVGRDGKRLTSIAIDKFGAKGEVDGRGVTFAHQGTLLALKALAARMPAAKPAP